MNIPVQTRSGRLVKKPDRYEPTEIVEDDYIESGDEEDDDDCTACEEEEEEESDSDSDADEDGNLKGFIVPDSDSESDSEGHQ
jgi:hypothetical protein